MPSEVRRQRQKNIVPISNKVKQLAVQADEERKAALACAEAIERNEQAMRAYASIKLQRQREALTAHERLLLLCHPVELLRPFSSIMPVVIPSVLPLYKVVAVNKAGALVSVFDGLETFALDRWTLAKHGGASWPPVYACMSAFATPEEAMQEKFPPQSKMLKAPKMLVQLDGIGQAYYHEKSRAWGLSKVRVTALLTQLSPSATLDVHWALNGHAGLDTAPLQRPSSAGTHAPAQAAVTARPHAGTGDAAHTAAGGEVRRDSSSSERGVDVEGGGHGPQGNKARDASPRNPPGSNQDDHQDSQQQQQQQQQDEDARFLTSTSFTAPAPSPSLTQQQPHAPLPAPHHPQPPHTAAQKILDPVTLHALQPLATPNHPHATKPTSHAHTPSSYSSLTRDQPLISRPSPRTSAPIERVSPRTHPRAPSHHTPTRTQQPSHTPPLSSTVQESFTSRPPRHDSSYKADVWQGSLQPDKLFERPGPSSPRSWTSQPPQPLRPPYNPAAVKSGSAFLHGIVGSRGGSRGSSRAASPPPQPQPVHPRAHQAVASLQQTTEHLSPLQLPAQGHRPEPEEMQRSIAEYVEQALADRPPALSWSEFES